MRPTRSVAQPFLLLIIRSGKEVSSIVTYNFCMKSSAWLKRRSTQRYIQILHWLYVVSECSWGSRTNLTVTRDKRRKIQITTSERSSTLSVLLDMDESNHDRFSVSVFFSVSSYWRPREVCLRRLRERRRFDYSFRLYSFCHEESSHRRLSAKSRGKSVSVFFDDVASWACIKSSMTSEAKTISESFFNDSPTRAKWFFSLHHCHDQLTIWSDNQWRTAVSLSRHLQILEAFTWSDFRGMRLIANTSAPDKVGSDEKMRKQYICVQTVNFMTTHSWFRFSWKSKVMTYSERIFAGRYPVSTWFLVSYRVQARIVATRRKMTSQEVWWEIRKLSVTVLVLQCRWMSKDQ